MIDHVAFNVSDLERSRGFYEQALAPLGYGLAFEMEGMVAFGPEGQSQVRNPNGRATWIAPRTWPSKPRIMRR